MKILLIIPMVVIELVLLGINCVVAFISPKAGFKMIHWCMKVLPSADWYMD